MKTRIAMIGAGNIANVHLEAYRRMKDVEIVAACDINRETLDKTCDRFGIEKRYTDESVMLRELKGQLDGVDVCVWNCNHAPCSIQALEAGLNVLCEKPMAYNAKEAQQMIEAAKKAGKLLMVGFVLRFSKEGRTAKELVENGTTGEIYYAKAQYVRRHGNPGGWFADKARSGGGPVIDLGVHVIDLTRFLMGNPKPVSVFGATFNKLGSRKHIRTGVEYAAPRIGAQDVDTVEDFGSAMVRYENGAVLQIEASYDINGEDIARRVVYGTKAGMDLSNGIKLFTEQNGYLANTELLTGSENFTDLFVSELSHYVDCIRNGTPCQAPAEDGLEIMKILDGIYESAATGHEVLL